MLTIFAVVHDFKVLLQVVLEGLPDGEHGARRGERAVQEVAHGGPLDHLAAGEAGHGAEAVRAVDDEGALPEGEGERRVALVGDHEGAACNATRETSGRQSVSRALPCWISAGTNNRKIKWTLTRGRGCHHHKAGCSASEFPLLYSTVAGLVTRYDCSRSRCTRSTPRRAMQAAGQNKRAK